MKRALLSLLFCASAILPSTAATDTLANLAEVEPAILSGRVDQSVLTKIQSVLKSDPNNAFAHFLLGECYQRLGWEDMASDEYALSAKLNRNPTQMLDWLKVCIERGDLYDAGNQLDYLKKQFPNDPSVQFLEAVRQDEKGDPKAQKEYFRLSTLPNHPLGANTALASGALRKKDYAEAIRLADVDLSAVASYPAACVAKAEALEGLGRPQEAIEYYRRAFALQPRRANVNWPLSRLLCHYGYNEEALKPMLYALAQSTEKQRAQRQMMVTRLLRVVPYGKQIKILDEVGRDLDQTSWGITYHTALGRVFDQMQMPDRAIMQYRYVLYKFNPNFEPAIFSLARDTERYLREYETALALYKKASVLNSRDKYNDDAWLRLSNRYYHRSNDIAWRLKDQLTLPAVRAPKPTPDDGHGIIIVPTLQPRQAAKHQADRR